ncbi:MAG: hypothetical protein CL941_03565 [Desulfobacter sp.]|nr:hypothetical protein [Desulfobacter sp.]MDP6806774.1 hypothetical protein [Desulfobacterales bacterium]
MPKKSNQKILNYYEKSSEGSRLESSMGQLEFEQSKEIIFRFYENLQPPLPLASALAFKEQYIK